MINNDTTELLKECYSGIKMGITSIDEVLNSVNDSNLKSTLQKARSKHEELEEKTHALLLEYNDNGKEPNPIAKGMSWLKTNVMIAVKDNDSAIADLMIDGCNMGIKSLNRYLNKYKAADECSKDIAKKLISTEEKLISDIKSYL